MLSRDHIALARADETPLRVFNSTSSPCWFPSAPGTRMTFFARGADEGAEAGILWHCTTTTTTTGATRRSYNIRVHIREPWDRRLTSRGKRTIVSIKGVHSMQCSTHWQNCFGTDRHSTLTKCSTSCSLTTWSPVGMRRSDVNNLLELKKLMGVEKVELLKSRISSLLRNSYQS